MVATLVSSVAGSVETTSSAGVCPARQRTATRASANPLVMVPTWQARQTFWVIRQRRYITPVRMVWIVSVGEARELYLFLAWLGLERHAMGRVSVWQNGKGGNRKVSMKSNR